MRRRPPPSILLILPILVRISGAVQCTQCPYSPEPPHVHDCPETCDGDVCYIIVNKYFNGTVIAGCLTLREGDFFGGSSACHREEKRTICGCQNAARCNDPQTPLSEFKFIDIPVFSKKNNSGDVESLFNSEEFKVSHTTQQLQASTSPSLFESSGENDITDLADLELTTAPSSLTDPEDGVTHTTSIATDVVDNEVEEATNEMSSVPALISTIKFESEEEIRDSRQEFRSSTIQGVTLKAVIMPDTSSVSTTTSPNLAILGVSVRLESSTGSNYAVHSSTNDDDLQTTVAGEVETTTKEDGIHETIAEDGVQNSTLTKNVQSTTNEDVEEEEAVHRTVVYSATLKAVLQTDKNSTPTTKSYQVDAVLHTQRLQTTPRPDDPSTPLELTVNTVLKTSLPEEPGDLAGYTTPRTITQNPIIHDDSGTTAIVLTKTVGLTVSAADQLISLKPPPKTTKQPDSEFSADPVIITRATLSGDGRSESVTPVVSMGSVEDVTGSIEEAELTQNRPRNAEQGAPSQERDESSTDSLSLSIRLTNSVCLLLLIRLL